MLPWHQYLLGIIFIVAGANHFRTPKVYERIIPPYLPAAGTLVLISGTVEMVLGLMLLNPGTQNMAAWGLIILLVLLLPVHFYMFKERTASLGLPKWLLLLRIPLQFGLIFWAFQYI